MFLNKTIKNDQILNLCSNWLLLIPITDSKTTKIMSLSDAAIAGIVAGSVIGGLALIILIVFLLRRWLRGPTKGSDNPKRLDGKTIVITGANTGIGKVTAIDLAKRGAHIVILCRNLQKASDAIKDIKSATGNDNVEAEQLDLASLASVRKCAGLLKEKLDKIDILINNAGIMTCPEWRTEDGFEMQLGTNHLGHFLLTELLLPLVKKSADTGFHPRIVILSSLAHESARGMQWGDLMFENGYDSIAVYAQSKLANLLHCKELARRLKDSGISVYALHPGTTVVND